MNPYDAGINGPAGKLIRNRSTKANDDWWRAVQDAAKTAPKLTYERSAPMANEDVLERYETWINSGIVGLDGGRHECARFAAELAAALREAREERKRLEMSDELLDLAIEGFNFTGLFNLASMFRDIRIARDAAMKPPGGEGSSHE